MELGIMDLKIQNNKVLPVWLAIWLTALIVFVDLSFLRATTTNASVASIKVDSADRGGDLCELKILLGNEQITRNTDISTCKQVSTGDQIKLEKTLLLDRWLGLYDEKDNKLTEGLLENRVLTDVLYILLALILPLVFNFKLSKEVKSTAYFLFGIEVIGTLYFWLLFLL